MKQLTTKYVKPFWKYTLDKEMEFHLPEYNGLPRQLIRKKDHKVLAEISPNGILHVYEGYSWDGCSPKYKVFDKYIVGVWDGTEHPVTGEQKLKYPSLVHDCLCQMFHGKKEDLKFYTRKHIDVIFCNEMKMWDVSFIQRKTYYYAVRLYAWGKGYV